MYYGYRRFLNGVALKNLLEVQYMPNASLGIGEAENVSPVPVTYEFVPETKKIDIPKADSIEETGKNLSGQQFTRDDFGQNFHFGDPIGGF